MNIPAAASEPGAADGPVPDRRTVTPPGRLGDPGLDLGRDPRSDPRLVAAMTALGLAGTAGPLPVGPHDPLPDRVAFVAAAEQGFEAVYAALFADLPDMVGVTRTVETFTGEDGNAITVDIHRPADQAGDLPGVLYLHGGGMVMTSTTGPCFTRWRDELAAAGLVVVGVEFRNGGGALGPHPFPAGLHDCFSALSWLHDNKTRLRVSSVVVLGESGGGNLALATALLARQRGQTALLDGVYAMAPLISGAYGWSDDQKASELASLLENDGYFLSCSSQDLLASVYDPDGANADNPLCWPYRATEQDLYALPPHVISVNELDPLRDEGLAYYRALTHAGVTARSRTVNGTCHVGDQILRAAMPDVFAATVADIHQFASNL